MASITDPRCVVIPNVFESRRQTHPVTPGQTVAAALPYPVRPDGSWIVIENGRVLSPDEWDAHLITRNTELICYPHVRGNNARLGIGIGLVVLALASGGVFAPALVPASMAMFAGALGAGLVLGAVQGMLMAPPKAQVTPSLTSDGGGSPTYGFGGISNSTRVGAPIPIVYGVHSTFPPSEAMEQPYAWNEVDDFDVEDEPIVSDEYEYMGAA